MVLLPCLSTRKIGGGGNYYIQVRVDTGSCVLRVGIKVPSCESGFSLTHATAFLSTKSVWQVSRECSYSIQQAT